MASKLDFGPRSNYNFSVPAEGLKLEAGAVTSNTLFAIQTNGVNRMSLDSGGNFTLSANVTIGALSIIGGIARFERPGGGGIAFGNDNVVCVRTQNYQALGINQSYPIFWGSDPSYWFSGGDLFLWRDAANMLGQRNGVNNQTFNLYNTYTDVSNYERLGVYWSSNVLNIGTQAAGTGTARNITISPLGGTLTIDMPTAAVDLKTFLQVVSGNVSLNLLRGNGKAGGICAGSVGFAINYDNSGIFAITKDTRANIAAGTWPSTATVVWQCDATGHFLAGADNTYDIGASGATRPRTGYFGTKVDITANNNAVMDMIQIRNSSNGSSAQTRLHFDNDQAPGTGKGGEIFYTSSTYASFPGNSFGVWNDSNGIIAFATNNVEAGGFTANGLFYLAGRTSSYPALKRNSAAVDFRLADDSGYASIGVNTITLGSYGTVSAPAVVLPNGTGWYGKSGYTDFGFAIGGNSILSAWAGGVFTSSGNYFGWSDNGSGDLIGTGTSTRLYRDANGIIGQRNGTNAQQFNIYKTYTDASNYEGGSFGFDGSGNFYMAMGKAGTGSSRGLAFYTGIDISFKIGATLWWQMSSSGHFITGADNTYDIGASNATRPRSVYVGTSVTVGNSTINSTANSSGHYVNGIDVLQSPSPAIFMLMGV